MPDLWWQAFIDGLRQHGWKERENVTIERRYAEPRKEASKAVVEELIRAGVDVIVVSSTATALAAKDATTRVPIVVTVPSDPVATGLVASLARPGGNVTGLSFVGTEIAGKQVELLHEAVPGLLRIADEHRSELVQLSTRAATLDDVFLALTGRTLAEAEQR